MPKLLPYIQNILIEYQNAPFPEKNHRKKDGAIVAVASIAKVIGADNYWKIIVDTVEIILSTVSFTVCVKVFNDSN